MWESEVSFRGRHWESISTCLHTLHTFFYNVWSGKWTCGTLRRHRCCHMATLGHWRTTLSRLLHLRCGGPWWACPASAVKSWVAPWAELRTLPCARLGLSAIPASFTASLPRLAVALMGRSVCTHDLCPEPDTSIPVLTLGQNMPGGVCRSHAQASPGSEGGSGKRCDFSVYILWTEHPLFKK